MGRSAVILLVLACVTAAVLAPVLQAGFIALDDEQYVTGNPHVRQGLSAETARWALTATEASNWHPATWLSHALDVQLFGLRPRGHHLTSLLLHLANACLLGAVLGAMTGRRAPSAFVAALFALHPLRVESVAWVSERKDVLSAFFLLLALGAYLRYCRRPGAGRYAAVLTCFALGLAAKPMVITLPFVLLLLDAWPLGRPLVHGRWSAAAARRLLLEKVPFLALSAASAIVTIVAQEQGEAIQRLHPLTVRLANAAVSYVSYLGKSVWPVDLAVFYPYPEGSLPGPTLLAAALLLGVSAAVVAAWRRLPFLAAGWFWYLGTLVPVIGLIQVGRQGMADRYTYLPLIGVFLAVSWGLASFLRDRRALVATALVVLAAFAALAHLQSRVWRDSRTLFVDAVRRTGDNWLAEYTLGLLSSQEGDTAAGSRHYRNALRIRPDCIEARLNLANLLAKEGHREEALGHYRELTRQKPSLTVAYVGLGDVLAGMGRAGEAVAAYQEAHRLDARYAAPLFGLAQVEVGRGDPRQAEARYREALALEPGYQEAANNLAILLVGLDRVPEAVAVYDRILALKPDFAEGHCNLATILASQGAVEQAAAHFREALRVAPGYREAQLGLERALAVAPRR